MKKAFVVFIILEVILVGILVSIKIGKTEEHYVPLIEAKHEYEQELVEDNKIQLRIKEKNGVSFGSIVAITKKSDVFEVAVESIYNIANVVYYVVTIVLSDENGKIFDQIRFLGEERSPCISITSLTSTEVKGIFRIPNTPIKMPLIVTVKGIYNIQPFGITDKKIVKEKERVKGELSFKVRFIPPGSGKE